MKQHLSPVIASLANVFRIPIRQIPSSQPSATALNRTCNVGLSSNAGNPGSVRSFSSSSPVFARKKGGAPKKDRRITLIRYFLGHPRTPRPLRFSRNRYLRHWTIHRAWQLYQAKQRAAHELELERQYNSMRSACEELRTRAGSEGVKLFRMSMVKTGVFTKPVPIEYGRLQTDTPSQQGWNYDWRPTSK